MVTALSIGIIILFLVPPCIVTIYNIVKLIKAPENNDSILHKIIDIYTIFGGLSLSIVLFCMIAFRHYSVAYYTTDFNILHEFFSSDHYILIILIIAISVIGYSVLRFSKIKLPPLFASILISFTYIGIIFSALYIVQLSKNTFNLYVPLFIIYPVNYIILSIITLRKTASNINVVNKNKTFNKITDILNSNNNLLVALYLLIPICGIFIILSILLNQETDSVIKIFTNTSDWTFSKQISPPPIEPEGGHYLCTVAANGHSKIVKPLRYGKRHGHLIIVNRQLQIANAFEDLIKEKMPKFHYFVRSNYDKYGYPISKHINTKLSADFVYIIMKPLEYIFLVVLYLFDLQPEKRISRQYI